MVGIARECPPFTLCIDSLGLLSEEQAAAFYADGIRAIGAYLEVLTPEARDAYFNAKLGIFPITEARMGALSAASGAVAGADSARRAMLIGCPPSVHITIDNESTHGSVEDVIGDFDAFDDALVAHGYGGQLYVGEPQVLSGAQLYALKVDRYFRSFSHVPGPDCGYCMLQLWPGDQTVHGARVDYDVVQRDYRGRGPIFWWPS